MPAGRSPAIFSRRRFLAASAGAALLPSAARAVGASLPIFDAHIHFSHDAAGLFSANEAVAILEKAGLKRALVSSSGDAGTRALYAAATDLVLPSLRPCRRRGEIGSWADDPPVIDFLEDRVKRFKWVAVGGFHLFASQTGKAVPRRMIELDSVVTKYQPRAPDIESAPRRGTMRHSWRIAWQSHANA